MLHAHTCFVICPLYIQLVSLSCLCGNVPLDYYQLLHIALLSDNSIITAHFCCFVPYVPPKDIHSVFPCLEIFFTAASLNNFLSFSVREQDNNFSRLLFRIFSKGNINLDPLNPPFSFNTIDFDGN